MRISSRTKDDSRYYFSKNIKEKDTGEIENTANSKTSIKSFPVSLPLADTATPFSLRNRTPTANKLALS